MNRDEIEELRNVDIRTVDRDSLVDIEKISINSELPKEKRLMEFVEKVKNPFCFICNGMVVKVSYDEKGDTLENRLIHLWLMKAEDGC